MFFSATFEYWRNLVWYCIRGRSFAECPYLRDPSERQARVQLFSLAMEFVLWNQPFYRHETYAHDLRANLRNVAVPGTVVPLSVFCYFKLAGYFLVFFMNPFFCFIGAINVARKDTSGKSFLAVMGRAYAQHLLYPEDWFSYWRLNCRLAALYELVTKEPGYALENKWAFIKDCLEKDVPCSPCLDMEGLCIKHKNEEGGMGIHFFKNAMNGGDWLIQAKLNNHSSVAKFLPKNAPLSTFRVMTGSKLGMASSGTKRNKSEPPIFAFSCVFRAGREGSSTDHDSILFDVDVPNKKMGVGTVNMHWYQIFDLRKRWFGLDKFFTTPWLNNNKFETHPDGDIPVTGEDIPEIDAMIQTCVDAHAKLFPGVPIAGWDLCVIDGEPKMCLLEVNLMCNFFKGSFDKPKYFEFMEDYFTFLEAHRKNQ